MLFMLQDAKPTVSETPTDGERSPVPPQRGAGSSKISAPHADQPFSGTSPLSMCLDVATSCGLTCRAAGADTGVGAHAVETANRIFCTSSREQDRAPVAGHWGVPRIRETRQGWSEPWGKRC